MRIIDILNSNQKGVSFEFFPPKTKQAEQEFKDTVETLLRYKPLYVSMTYGAGGSTKEYTKDATYFLLSYKQLTVMPHLTCIGATKESIKSLLDEYVKSGIQNIMALRGDPPKDGSLDIKNSDFKYARDLVRFIKKNYNLCISVAVYPEGHKETASFKKHLVYMKQKIDEGADFAITQMFFDNIHFYIFLEKIRKLDVKIPIIPGILPLYDITKAKQFCETCNVKIPKNILAKMESFKSTPEQMQKIGLEFTLQQCQDLIKNGFTKIHFFTLNKAKIITQLLDKLEQL